jgi:putative ABC transport system permease protein
MFSRFIARVRAWRHRREIRDTVDEELLFHVEMESAANRAEGLAAAEARKAALRDLGGAAQVREAVIDVRTPRTTASIDAFRQDVTYAFRVLRRTPLFVTGLLVTLALGIGANGAVFSIVRAVLLQPLPYRVPDRLAMVWVSPEHPPATSTDILRPVIRRSPPPEDLALAIHSQSGNVLADTATYLSWQGNLEPQFDLTVADHTERLRGTFATANFFDVLGVTAAEGRVFTAADESAHVQMLVLSDALWHRAFGADRSVIGRTLTMLAGRPRQLQTFTIIGVLPPTFRFTYPLETEAWAILSWTDLRAVGVSGYWTVARLAPGVTFAVAQARVRAIPTTPRGRPSRQIIFRLEPITEWVVAEARPSVLLLAGVALLLLVITCATVANALFVRVTERQRELAVRASLGADRRRLIRQLLTEGALLSAAGAALGTGLAAVLAPALRTLVPASIPRADELAADAWTVAFFAVTAGVVTILAAAAPAWRGTRVDLVSALKRAATVSSADRSTVHWRQGLIALESAVASSLLLTATLLLVSFWQLSHVPLGFDGDRVLTVEMRLLSPRYLPPPAPRGTSPAPPTVPAIAPALVAFQDQLIAGVRALPGVLDAGLTSAVPFRGVDFVFVMNRAGSTKSVGGNGRFVDPGYFSVLKVPLVRGRVFSAVDTSTNPRVVVISQAYARQMFGDEDPIGQVIEGDHPLEVIGVVGDMRYKSADADPYPAIYFPRSQVPSELICVVARTAPNAGDLGPAIRRLVHRLDPDVPAMNVTTVDQIVADSVSDRRFYTTSTSAFASLALVLTMVGLVVVIARAVAERRRELAIRAALGASATEIAALVLRSGLVPVVAGLGVGLGAVFAGATALNQFLFQVAPRAPWAYAGVGVIILVVAVIAALAPVRRAVRVSPALVLRAD